MMNALRMVWTISRHFNTDDKMLPLMERIAAVIAQRVKQVIKVCRQTVACMPANLVAGTRDLQNAHR